MIENGISIAFFTGRKDDNLEYIAHFCQEFHPEWSNNQFGL